MYNNKLVFADDSSVVKEITEVSMFESEHDLMRDKKDSKE